MSWSLPNMGRRHTSSRVLEVLLSDTADSGTYTGPFTVQFRDGTGPWTPSRPFRNYMTMSLNDTLGDHTVSTRFTDTLGANFTLTQVVTLVDELPPGMPWDPTTQEIANNLPSWHVGRRLRSSNWQRFMNIPATALGQIKRLATDVRNAMFLGTCPTDEIDLVGRLWPDPDKLGQERPETNIISNPALVLPRQAWGEPQNWALRGVNALWAQDNTQTLFGRTGLSFPLAATRQATLVHEIPAKLNVGESVSALVHYLTSIGATLASPLAGQDFNFNVILLQEDGTTVRGQATLATATEGTWWSATATATATARVTRAWVVLAIEHITAAGALTLTVGGVQASRGTVGAWSSGETWPHWLSSHVSTALEASRDLWMTSSEQDFGRDAIPTRSGVASSPVAGTWGVPVQAAPEFEVRDALQESWQLGWLAAGGRVKLYEAGTNSLLRSFQVAFWSQGAESFIPAPGFIVEAVTWSRDRLWAVGYFDEAADATPVEQMTGTLGAAVQGANRVRYLVLLAQAPAEPPAYLEAVQVLPLILLAKATALVSLEFATDDQHWIYYRSAANEYYNRLYYDYGMPQPDGSVWVREATEPLTLA